MVDTYSEQGLIAAPGFRSIYKSLMKKYNSSESDVPLLVHCGSGQRLSCTFIALMVCLDLVMLNLDFDFPRVIGTIQKQRSGAFERSFHDYILLVRTFFYISYKKGKVPEVAWNYISQNVVAQ